MKKIIYFVAIVVLGLTSCNDFLSENPKTSPKSNSYYKTEAQALANVNDLYRNGAAARFADATPSAYHAPYASVPGCLTGYFSNAYEGQERVYAYSRELIRQDHTSEISSMSDDVWNNCYSAVNVANNAIAYIPDISMNETFRAQLVAEAKFFRAFNYFYLVKTFGDVPLLIEPTEPETDLYPNRAPKSDVYAQIEQDLKDAVEVLPAKTFADNGHRITKYAAAMVLADVYFHQGNYADAKTYSKMVIDSPHTLTANIDLDANSAYNQLRSKDDLNEVIYAEEFDGSINASGWWPTYAFDANAVTVFDTYSIFTRVYGPMDIFLNVYDPTDLRVQEKQFFCWNYTNPNNGKTWTAPTAANAPLGVAGCWYFFDEAALLSTAKGTKDYNFYRLAEAYLDYAESIAQTEGVTAEAANYLALVQARAKTDGTTADQIKTDLQALSKQDFIEACWTERLREFPLEFKIWDDCVRTMKYPVISKEVRGKVTYVDLIGATNAAKGTFKATDLVFPISLAELQRNPNLVQNEGYASK